jgi:hypothetical protein
MPEYITEDEDWISRPAFWRAAEACRELYAAPPSEQARKRVLALALIEAARGVADFEEIEVAIVYEAFDSDGTLSERDMRYVYSRMSALLTGDSPSAPSGSRSEVSALASVSTLN